MDPREEHWAMVLTSVTWLLQDQPVYFREVANSCTCRSADASRPGTARSYRTRPWPPRTGSRTQDSREGAGMKRILAVPTAVEAAVMLLAVTTGGPSSHGSRATTRGR